MEPMMETTEYLPHGTGKDVKVLVFAKGDMIEEAERRDKLIGEVKKYGWSVNPDTGKLEKL